MDSGYTGCLQKVGQRSGVSWVGLPSGLYLQGEQKLWRVQHDIYLPTAVGSVEAGPGWIRVPGQPAKELIDDGGLKDRAVLHTHPIRQEAPESRIGPVQLRGLYQPGGDGRQEGPEQEDLIRDLEEPYVPLDGVRRDAKCPRNLRIGEKLVRPGGQKVLGQGELTQVGHLAQVCEVTFKIRPAEVPEPDPSLLLRQWLEGRVAP